MVEEGFGSLGGGAAPQARDRPLANLQRNASPSGSRRPSLNASVTEDGEGGVFSSAQAAEEFLVTQKAITTSKRDDGDFIGMVAFENIANDTVELYRAEKGRHQQQIKQYFEREIKMLWTKLDYKKTDTVVSDSLKEFTAVVYNMLEGEIQRTLVSEEVILREMKEKILNELNDHLSEYKDEVAENAKRDKKRLESKLDTLREAVRREVLAVQAQENYNHKRELKSLEASFQAKEESIRTEYEEKITEVEKELVSEKEKFEIKMNMGDTAGQQAQAKDRMERNHYEKKAKELGEQLKKALDAVEKYQSANVALEETANRNALEARESEMKYQQAADENDHLKATAEVTAKKNAELVEKVGEIKREAEVRVERIRSEFYDTEAKMNSEIERLNKYILLLESQQRRDEAMMSKEQIENLQARVRKLEADLKSARNNESSLRQDKMYLKDELRKWKEGSGRDTNAKRAQEYAEMKKELLETQRTLKATTDQLERYHREMSELLESSSRHAAANMTLEYQVEHFRQENNKMKEKMKEMEEQLEKANEHFHRNSGLATVQEDGAVLMPTDGNLDEELRRVREYVRTLVGTVNEYYNRHIKIVIQLEQLFEFFLPKDYVPNLMPGPDPTIKGGVMDTYLAEDQILGLTKEDSVVYRKQILSELRSHPGLKEIMLIGDDTALKAINDERQKKRDFFYSKMLDLVQMNKWLTKNRVPAPGLEKELVSQERDKWRKRLADKDTEIQELVVLANALKAELDAQARSQQREIQQEKDRMKAEYESEISKQVQSIISNPAAIMKYSHAVYQRSNSSVSSASGMLSACASCGRDFTNGPPGSDEIIRANQTISPTHVRIAGPENGRVGSPSPPGIMSGGDGDVSYQSSYIPDGRRETLWEDNYTGPMPGKRSHRRLGSIDGPMNSMARSGRERSWSTDKDQAQTGFRPVKDDIAAAHHRASVDASNTKVPQGPTQIERERARRDRKGEHSGHNLGKIVGNPHTVVTQSDIGGKLQGGHIGLPVLGGEQGSGPVTHANARRLTRSATSSAMGAPREFSTPAARGRASVVGSAGVIRPSSESKALGDRRPTLGRLEITNAGIPVPSMRHKEAYDNIVPSGNALGSAPRNHRSGSSSMTRAMEAQKKHGDPRRLSQGMRRASYADDTVDSIATLKASPWASKGGEAEFHLKSSRDSAGSATDAGQKNEQRARTPSPIPSPKPQQKNHFIRDIAREAAEITAEERVEDAMKYSHDPNVYHPAVGNGVMEPRPKDEYRHALEQDYHYIHSEHVMNRELDVLARDPEAPPEVKERLASPDRLRYHGDKLDFSNLSPVTKTTTKKKRVQVGPDGLGFEDDVESIVSDEAAAGVETYSDNVSQIFGGLFANGKNQADDSAEGIWKSQKNENEVSFQPVSGQQGSQRPQTTPVRYKRPIRNLPDKDTDDWYNSLNVSSAKINEVVTYDETLVRRHNERSEIESRMASTHRSVATTVFNHELTDINPEKIRLAFDCFDPQKTGRMPVTKLPDAMSALGVKLSKDDVKKIMVVNGKRRTGQITYRELMILVRDIRKKAKAIPHNATVSKAVY